MCPKRWTDTASSRIVSRLLRNPSRLPWSAKATFSSASNHHGPVVVVAHSHAGPPVEVAAPEVGGQMALIVCLDSFALAGGEAIADFFPPGMMAGIRAQAGATGDGWAVDPLPSPRFGLERDADIEFVIPRLTRQPLRAMLDRVTVAPGAEAVPRAYVECRIGADTKPFGEFASRARAAGWDVREIDAGHDAMVTHPAVVAALLIELAGPRSPTAPLG